MRSFSRESGSSSAIIARILGAITILICPSEVVDSPTAASAPGSYRVILISFCCTYRACTNRLFAFWTTKVRFCPYAGTNRRVLGTTVDCYPSPIRTPANLDDNHQNPAGTDRRNRD